MPVRINKNTEATIYTWLLLLFVYSTMLFGYISSILSILLFLFWMIFSQKTLDISSVKSRLLILFSSLYFVYMFGLIYTNNFRESLSTIEAKSALLIFPLVFGTTSVLNESLLKRISIHFFIAALLAAVVGLLYGAGNYFRTGNVDLLTGNNILFPGGFRPFLMGIYCLTAIIIGFNESARSPLTTKGLFFAGITLLSLLIFLLSIRMIIAGWFIIMFYYTLSLTRPLLHKAVLVVGFVLILLISAFTIPTLNNQWKEVFDRTGRSQIALDKDSSLGRNWGGKALRFAIWKCSADILKKHWFFGLGTGDVQNSLQQAYEKRKFYFASRYNRYNAHNQYIQITLATGIFGLFILLGCILYPLWQYKRKFSSHVYLLFLLLFCLICFTESILEANKGVMWYSFFNSIFAFGYLKSDAL